MLKNMKPVLAAIASVIVGYLAASYIVGNQKEEAYQKQLDTSESNWQAERENLLGQLAAERNKPPRIQNVYKEIPVGMTNVLSPTQILNKLIELKPNEYEPRNQTFREVIYYLQSLAHAEDYSLPVIRDFLAQNVDVDYAQSNVNAAGERNSRGAFYSRNVVRTDFLVPPSLRLGLLSVLEQIGGVEAEEILAYTLATTARGVEVAYLARILQDMRPDYYREAAIAAARELLSNPPAYESPNRLDENAKAYLYQVLSMYNDTAFAQQALGLILTPEMRVDKHALDYVEDVLKDQSVPAILQAYNNPALTNQMERSILLNTALRYTGPNQQANQMFSQMITNAAIPSGLRAYTIQGLAGSSRIEAPSDPYLIRARIELLDALQATVIEDRIQRAIQSTRKDLDDILLGKTTP